MFDKWSREWYNVGKMEEGNMVEEIAVGDLVVSEMGILACVATGDGKIVLRKPSVGGDIDISNGNKIVVLDKSDIENLGIEVIA